MIDSESVSERNPLAPFYADFPSSASARQFLESIRWPRGPVCPRCDSRQILTSTPSRRSGFGFRCRECDYFFSVTSSTPMHGAVMNIQKWLLLWWLIAHTRRPLSGPQIARALDTDLHTAWSITRIARLTLAKIQAQRLNPIPLQSALPFEKLLQRVMCAGRVR